MDLHHEAGAPPVARIKYSNMALYKSRKLSVRTPEGLHHHRALYDCYITAALLIDIMNTSGWTPDDMATITGRPALLTTFTFGKYRGKAVSDIADKDRAICAGCTTTWTK